MNKRKIIFLIIISLNLTICAFNDHYPKHLNVENRINKVEPLLYELSNIYQNESWDEVETFISQKGIRIQKDRRIRVVVEFNVSDINSFVEGIKYLGVRPQRVQRKDLQILIPLSLLAVLQKLPEVQYVRFPTKDEIDAVSEATALIQINDEIKKNQAGANKKIE
jgi:hypothetical protein